jgi:hypothetical protein
LTHNISLFDACHACTTVLHTTKHEHLQQFPGQKLGSGARLRLLTPLRATHGHSLPSVHCQRNMGPSLKRSHRPSTQRCRISWLCLLLERMSTSFVVNASDAVFSAQGCVFFECIPTALRSSGSCGSVWTSTNSTKITKRVFFFLLCCIARECYGSCFRSFLEPTIVGSFWGLTVPNRHRRHGLGLGLSGSACGRFGADSTASTPCASGRIVPVERNNSLELMERHIGAGRFR